MAKPHRASRNPSLVDVSYDRESNLYRVESESTDDCSLATTVVLAVAEVADTTPTELDPLHDVFDPEALDRIFADRERGAATDRVSFDYAGYRVTVYRDGETLVQPEKSQPVDAAQ